MKSYFVVLLLIFLSVNVISQDYSPVLLVKNPELQYMQPVCSPDGEYVAFTEANYRGIWIMKSDGSDLKKISDEYSAGYRLQWSRDSRFILSRVSKYEEYRRFNAVKIFNVQNGTSQQITDYVSLMPGVPFWSAGNESVIIPVESKLEKVASGISPANLKNNTALTCFEYKDQIAVQNSKNEEIVYLDPVAEAGYLRPVASPSGDKIAFEVVGGNMFVMNNDGSDLVDLGEGYAPKFSPDGSQIVFMLPLDDGHRYTASDIYIINTDGSNRLNLTGTSEKIEMNPDWSPENNEIFFDVLYEGAIYKIEMR